MARKRDRLREFPLACAVSKSILRVVFLQRCESSWLACWCCGWRSSCPTAVPSPSTSTGKVGRESEGSLDCLTTDCGWHFAAAAVESWLEQLLEDDGDLSPAQLMFLKEREGEDDVEWPDHSAIYTNSKRCSVSTMHASLRWSLFTIIIL